MAQVQAHAVGRLVTVVLAPGELVVESLARAAGDLGIRSASVSFSGSLAAARLILGQRKYSRAADDPDRVSFDDTREVLGSGGISQREPGVWQVELRGAVGRDREVFVGDIVEATVAGGLSATLIEMAPEAE